MVKERVELYLNPPIWAFMASCRVNLTFTLYQAYITTLCVNYAYNIMYWREG